MRSKKSFLNTSASLALEVVTVISGLILPRLILSRFGSSYNGVTSSISQFIGYVSLLSAGIGGVTRASLYKPLEERNTEKISAIVKATEIFMRKVAYIFIAGLVVFAAVYPFLVIEDFDWFFTFTLALILGIGTFAQYFFGISYQMVLNADQKQFVSVSIRIGTIIANIIIAAVLIKSGATIHMVRLGSSLVFMLNPIIIFIYVRRRYKIIDNVVPDTGAIEQRWDAFAHQIANFAHSNTDIVLLSFFSNVREISVYTVYYAISGGVKKLVTSISTGIEAGFGNMIARKEMEAVNRNLSLLEFLIYSTSIIVFTTMALLIVPFVSIYTKNITDVNYIRPEFGYLIAFVEFFFCMRIPYQAIARAAGHYRQTRDGAIFEASLNIVISLLLVKSLGLVGVTIGTLCAMIFRSVQYGIYVSRNIINRSTLLIVKRFILSMANAACIILLMYFIKLPQVDSYLGWVINGFIVTSISIAITIIFSLLFYREDLSGFLQLMRRILKRGVKTA